MNEKISDLTGLRWLGDDKFATSLRAPLHVLRRETPQQKDLFDAMDNAVTLTDLAPEDGDYLKVKFRALSAAYLGESGYFLDFSKKGVLKSSIPLLLTPDKAGVRRSPLKVMKNHSRNIDDIIGRVDSAEWSKGDPGLSAPGINTIDFIDWRLAPRQARQLMSDPPLLESTSMNLIYSVEKSHPDMDFWDFISVLGHEVDGDIVRWIVQEIHSYGHKALVDEGADAEADALHAWTAALTQAGKLKKKLISHGVDLNEGTQSQSEGGSQMEKFELSEILVERLAGALGVDKLARPDELVAEVLKLSDHHKRLKEESDELSEKASRYDEIIAEKRQQLKSLAEKLDGEDGKVMHVAIDRMDHAELTQLAGQYEKRIAEKYGRSSVDEVFDHQEELQGAPVDMSRFQL